MALVAAALHLATLGTGPAGPATGTEHRPRSRSRSHPGALAAALAGTALALAAFEQPLLLLLTPAVLAALGRWSHAAVATAAMLATLALVGGLSHLATGAATPYLGVPRRAVAVDRAWALLESPLEVPPQVQPTALGGWDDALGRPDVEPLAVVQDLGYLVAGRHLGLLARQPLALVALVLLLLHPRGARWRWLLGATLAAAALFLVAWLPRAWDARFLVPFLPGFPFLVTRLRPPALVVAAVVASSCLAALPATRAAVLARLPLEWPHLDRVPGTVHLSTGCIDLHAPAGTLATEGEAGFRPAPDATTEVWLESGEPLPSLALLVDGQGPGRLRLDLDGGVASAELDGGRHTVALRPERPERRRRLGPSRVLHSRRLRLTGDTAAGAGPVVTVIGTADQIEADLYAVEWLNSDVPRRVEPGQWYVIFTRLTNRSPYRWPARGLVSVKLSYRWQDERGQPVGVGGLRTPLVRDVPAGATVQVTQQVRAPLEPGRYVLELDPVHELVAWFSRRNGGNVHRVEVEVGK
jgi:hypothetical protein